MECIWSRPGGQAITHWRWAPQYPDTHYSLLFLFTVFVFCSVFVFWRWAPPIHTILLYCIFMSWKKHLFSEVVLYCRCAFFSKVTFFCLNRFFPKTLYYCLLVFDNVYVPTRQWANRQANQKGIASKTKPVNIWHIVFFESKLSSSKILLCFSQP